MIQVSPQSPLRYQLPVYQGKVDKLPHYCPPRLSAREVKPAPVSTIAAWKASLNVSGRIHQIGNPDDGYTMIWYPNQRSLQLGLKTIAVRTFDLDQGIVELFRKRDEMRSAPYGKRRPNRNASATPD